MALDSEYDACKETNLKIPCKITIVNEEGLVILDTLINQNDPEGNPRNLYRVPQIHGIPSEVLQDAPTFTQVKEHICSLLDPATTVIVGHSVKQDLLVMELTGYNFVDTSIIMDLKQPKSLKECLATLLNADI